MRRIGFWLPIGALTAAVLTLWGVWTWRLGTVNRNLALQIEADRQRNFNDMAYHVEQIQALLGKGLVSSNARSNMRYMSDTHHHAAAAVANFTSLPLPAQVSAQTGKFLQQIGDFALSLLRNEAADRDMDNKQREDLARLRTDAEGLSTSLQGISTTYNQGGFRWSPPARFSWSALWRGTGLPGKPATGAQAPASMVAGGWDKIGASMEKLPVMIYDGPFSDHTARQSPAVAGAPVTQEDAARRVSAFVPNGKTYRIASVSQVNGNLPTFSFRLTPVSGTAGGAGTTSGAASAYTVAADISRNGGNLTQFINSRMVGKPTMDLARARNIGQDYLTSIGYASMIPTYGQVADGTATIAYAFATEGVVVYPDQIKLKVALDNGEIVALDARQYLMAHHTRTVSQPKLTPEEAGRRVNPNLQVERIQLVLVPDLAGTGEILAYEFLGTMGDDTYLVYINANTGSEEQVLQQIETDGGTFAL